MSASIAASPLTLRYDANGLGLVLHCRPMAVALTYLTIATLFLLSGTTLEAVGIPYGVAGGNALLKIHPATYLSLITLLFWVGADGGLAPFIGRSWIETPGFLVFLMAIAILLFQTAVQKAPISSVTDNFVLAACLFAALQRLRPDEIGRLGRALQWFFFVNSLIGYAEVIGNFHLAPVYENGQLATYDWRARAILGHPLVNSMLTSLYIITLGLGLGPARAKVRLALIVFHLGAMMCFGGRTSTVLALIALSLIGSRQLMFLLIGRRFSYGSAAFAVLALMAAALVLPAAYDLGLFDKFLSRFMDDYGSAGTRVAMLSIFRDMSLPEIMIAPDQVTIYATQMKLGLSIAIESAVIGSIARYGGLVSLLLLFGLIAYFAEFVRLFGLRPILPLSIYAVIASSSTSFSTKSTEIACITIILFLQFGMSLYRARPARHSDAMRSGAPDRGMAEPRSGPPLELRV